MSKPDARRTFLKRLASAAGALMAAPTASVAQRRARGAPSAAARAQASQIGPLDHVAIPIQDVEAMVAFYRALGFVVREGPQIVSIHFADQKINFHRPALWQSGGFTLRASAARPPCGDFCWVWHGSRESLLAAFARAGAEIEVEGERTGGRDGGDAVGRSTYTRDPDGNLLEFIRYG
jgi:catechol 2,3-dioxygenase-like lactoylglutathione lyase family enzyme